MNINTWVLYVVAGLIGIVVFVVLVELFTKIFKKVYDNDCTFTSVISSLFTVAWAYTWIINPCNIADELTLTSKILICIGIIIFAFIAGVFESIFE